MTVKKPCLSPEAAKHKTLSVKFTASPTQEVDDEYYRFEGYGAVFDNIDSYGDVILKGAFQESLKELTPALCYQHWMSDVIGVIDEAFEDDKGLYIKCRIPKSHRQGGDVAALIKCGGLKEMSIGYVELDVTRDKINGEEIQYLQKVKLYEISVVTHAANKEALITSFKSGDAEVVKSLKDVETILKSAFSSKMAKILISKTKEFSLKRDAEEEEKGEDRDDTQVKNEENEEENQVLQKLEEAIQRRRLLNYLN